TDTSDTPGGSSVLATIQDDPELSTLAGLLEGTELETTLESGGSYTILAPTNNILDNMPNFNDAQIEEILSYHIIAEDRASAVFQNGDAMATVYGDSVFVVSNRINHKASITSGDIDASNGTIHKIDNLLLPDA